MSKLVEFLLLFLALDLVSARKRGVAWPWYNEGTNLSITQLTSVNVQWIYNWETWRPSATGGLNFIGTQRCTDCPSSPIKELYARAIGQGWTTVFTLNEPDLPIGGTSPADAAGWYIRWINPLNITKAIPAVTSSKVAGQGLDWIDRFIQACAGQCFFDYINLHWYGSSFEEFKAHIEGARNRFPAYKLVVTEFALLPPATREDQTAFLNNAMTLLDNTTYVDYYAIFLATSPALITSNNGGSDYAGTTSTLFGDDGSLTLNGVAYRG
ncbi:Alkali-sensitive linkage protein 1 OS=Schizosaccharomyces pombe (strain 972 / ATCC 24843) GN=asl1 PE=1 SV=1 [Rhizoctonia solani AG-1 IB]|uniref:Alkali-sensitive linkage protein 1 n=1 Tax=Thanatephorus cucumeris (strain AG1-IB / isolate 7/3/14) TaxID=1108050 RepID=A0A0B7G478_THACB|nr:Alkali-sensitive linkage protein 1 OS=Schizosaccharomyces pombe (strain 972 / ATCC 24843) GN=asl1 PE=1 SV=1 [Rhizoctonia solani AG-1 IB]